MLLPIIVTCMLIVISDHDIMGNYTNGDNYQRFAWVMVGLLYLLDLMLVVFSIFPIGR